MMLRTFAGTALAALALVVPAGSAAPTTTYADASGDSGAAADITSITITNDPSGLITFRLSVANRPGALNADDVVGLGIDSDRTPSTGDQDGDEYLLVLGSAGAAVFKWNGTKFDTYAHGPVAGSYSAGVAQMSVNKADLGGAASFDFYSFDFVADETTIDHDVAPENGNYTYTLTAPVTIDSADAFFTPAAPKAGALFGVTRVVLYMTDKSSARAASYSCTARLAGKALKPVGRCKWKIPANSKGKRLTVTVSAASQNDSGTFDPWTFRVR